MPKKGELSKTARASLANRKEDDHLTDRVCAVCGEGIEANKMLPVKVIRSDGHRGMVYYHKDHYSGKI